MTTERLHFAARIIQEVARRHGIDPMLIIKPGRKPGIHQARWEVFHILDCNGWTRNMIAILFKHDDGRPIDPTTVRNGLRRHRGDTINR
jgi:hypothetical protein